MDDNTQESQAVAAQPTVNDSKQEILNATLAALRQIPGFGTTVVHSKKQPILKVITPRGEAFNVTVK